MRKTILLIVIILCSPDMGAQRVKELTDNGQFSTFDDQRRPSRDSVGGSNKEIPKGLKVWTIDEQFGDRFTAVIDTMPHMYMNSIFTAGTRGEYNILGNLGSPRQNRIFIDRQQPSQFSFMEPYDYFITPVEQFHFTNTLSPITNISFNTCGNQTNGEDHIKALFAVNAGKRIGIGFKFDYLYGRGYYQNQGSSHFNYTMYGSYLGDHYQAHLLMSTNHQKVSENGGITDDRYVTHPEFFEDDFRTDEIPVVLSSNWNRNDNQHIFLSHRYSLGFNRKVPMTEEEIKAKKFAMESQKQNEARKKMEEARKKAREEGEDFDEKAFNENEKKFAGRPADAKIMGAEPVDTTKQDNSHRIAVDGKAAADSLLAKEQKAVEDTSWLKNEFVPVTSFIHTMKFDNYRRVYQAYNTPADYYLDTYEFGDTFLGDSIYDNMRHYELKNTFAISLLEGFNKWAKAGLKAFITSDLRHFTIPDSIGSGRIGSWRTTYNEHNISVGGQLSKTEGTLLHYNAKAETWLTGEDAGQIKIDGSADLNVKILGDTAQLAVKAYLYRLNPTFFQRHFHSKHAWWDQDLEKETRSRLEAALSYQKTRTKIRVAFDDIKNYTYLSNQYTITEQYGRAGNKVAINQHTGNLSLLTLQLSQDLTLGPINWESVVTYQKSSNTSVLPVPDINIYTNLFLRFMVAKVLRIDLGADARYFTKYHAPDYSPLLGQFVVQDNGDNNTDVGGYPIINVYANMHLKHTRFFVMMTHVNAGDGGNRFFVPHYPLNGMILRLGLSWNFFN
ncbi:MAG: hypothetical protein IKH64_02480 [Prevotella sp.]|nr:hypothetical protein [Prevotella sp.]